MKRSLLLATVGVLSLCLGSVYGGVRQNNVKNTTNIGTNPYKDMEAGYATVNPNYSDGATEYPEDYGSAQVDPRNMGGGNEAVVASGYYYDYDAWASAATPGSLIPIGSILEYVPSRAVPLMVQSTRYYYADNTFLIEVFDGNMVVYQVVPAPIGAVVQMLPGGCGVRNFNGKSLTVCGTTYYRQVAGGFEVVASN